MELHGASGPGRPGRLRAAGSRPAHGHPDACGPVPLRREHRGEGCRNVPEHEPAHREGRGDPDRFLRDRKDSGRRGRC